MKMITWLCAAALIPAGCVTPYTATPDPLEAGKAMALAQSSPRWGHMTGGEAVQTIQDVYRDFDRFAKTTVTSNAMEVVCILDHPEAHPTRRVAFAWRRVKDIAVYRQDWKDGRMTYDIYVRYAARDDAAEPVILEYGIGHTLSGHAFPAADAADILCALYALTGRAPDAAPAAGTSAAGAARSTGRPLAPSVESRLRRLKQLHQDGLITDEVFRQKQEDILKAL